MQAVPGVGSIWAGAGTWMYRSITNLWKWISCSLMTAKQSLDDQGANGPSRAAKLQPIAQPFDFHIVTSKR